MTVLAGCLQRYFTDYAHTQRDLSPHTISAYRDTWRLLIKHITDTQHVPAEQITLEGITVDVVTGFLDILQDERGNSVSTRNARLTAIRAVLAYLLPDHLEHGETIARVLAIPAKRRPTRTIDYLSDNEVTALLDAPDPGTFTGRRDRALLFLAAQTGMRISELIELTTSDIHLGDAPAVTCTGKGRRQRSTPLTPATVDVLANYLAERRPRAGQALFPGPGGQHLSRDALEHRLAIHLRTASRSCPSLSGKHVTMHTLRHTAAMRLLHAGVDVAVIALWLGHQHTNSTDCYLHADMRIKQAAVDRTTPLHVEPGTYTPKPDILTWLDTL